MYKINKVFDHIFAFEEEGVTSFFILGKNKCVMIDTGFGVIDYMTEIRKITDLPVILINTHGDYDHVKGNGQFIDKYIKIEDFELLKENLPDEKNYNWLQNGDIFDLGGVELEIIDCPGHTYGSIMIYDKTNKIMFTADNACLDPLWMFGQNRNHQLFIDSLERILAMNLPMEKLMPSHGPYPLGNCYNFIKDTVGTVRKQIENIDDYVVCDLDTGEEVIKVKKYICNDAEVYTEQV